MGTPVEDRLALSIAATMKVVGLSRGSLCKQIYAKRLPAKKLGGRIVILVDDLMEYLRSLPAV
jgi:hypothetical protein